MTEKRTYYEKKEVNIPAAPLLSEKERLEKARLESKGEKFVQSTYQKEPVIVQHQEKT